MKINIYRTSKKKVGAYHLIKRYENISATLYFELNDNLDIEYDSYRVLVNDNDISNLVSISDDFVTSPILFEHSNEKIEIVFENSGEVVMNVYCKPIYNEQSETKGILTTIYKTR